MSFATEFDKFDSGAGALSIDMDGVKIEMPYSANFYIDGSGTIAAAETTDPESGAVKVLFLSNAPTPLYTFGGQRTGAAEIEGATLNTVAGADTEALLAAHLAAIAGKGVAAIDALKVEIRNAPQQVATLSMKLLAKLMAAWQS